MKQSLLFLALTYFFGMKGYAMENLGVLEEIQFPADDLNASTLFYQKLGFTVVAKEDWGFVQLKRANNEILALMKREFQKEISLSYKSPNVSLLKKELLEKELKIEEDGTDSTRVKTLSFRDPSGNLIFVFEGQ